MKVRQESFIPDLAPDYGKDTSHANRGMALETALNYTNARYAAANIAVVHKVPTHITPIRGNDGKVCTVKYEQSTVDYMGRIGDLPIAFEAKETAGASIALDRLQEHQARFLQQWGYKYPSFVLVAFNGLADAFVVPAMCWELARAARRQGTPLDMALCGADDGLHVAWRATGKASIRADELPADWRARVGYDGIDYAPVVMRLWGGACGENGGRTDG